MYIIICIYIYIIFIHAEKVDLIFRKSCVALAGFSRISRDGHRVVLRPFRREDLYARTGGQRKQCASTHLAEMSFLHSAFFIVLHDFGPPFLAWYSEEAPCLKIAFIGIIGYIPGTLDPRLPFA